MTKLKVSQNATAEVTNNFQSTSMLIFKINLTIIYVLILSIFVFGIILIT